MNPSQLTSLGGAPPPTVAKRVAIFGATGGTGIELTRQALDAGLHVRVLVRNPRRMPLVDNRIRYVVGDVFHRESVVKTLLGADAVFSCLGLRSLRKHHVCENGTKTILDVMRQHGVRRIIVEGAHGVADSYQRSTAASRLAYSTFLRNSFADKLGMEQAIVASDSEWTIVRPVILTNGPRTSQYRAAADLHAGVTSKISRADTADFMLKCYTDRSWIGEAPTISY